MCRWQMTLQAPGGGLWRATVNDSGFLGTTLIASGAPESLFLQDNQAGATFWQVVVSDTGYLNASPVAGQAGMATSIAFVTSTSNNYQASVSVLASGWLEASVTTTAQVFELPMSFVRQFPSHLLVDMIANPQFSLCLRQATANHLVWREAAFFLAWNNYFLGYGGTPPRDPIAGMIATRSAEDPVFNRLLLQAVPIQ